jgi:hypothetical protein
LAGGTHRASVAIAFCMNTRGLMELVAINVGRELGVVTPSMYTKLVLMAILSTAIVSPVARRLVRARTTVSDAYRADEDLNVARDVPQPVHDESATRPRRAHPIDLLTVDPSKETTSSHGT